MNKEKVSFLLLQVKELSFVNPFSYRREEIESEILQSLGRIRIREERFVKIDPRFDQVLHWLSLVEDYLLTDDSEEFSGKKWTASKEALAYFCLFHELIPELDSLSKLSKTVDSKNRSVFRMVMNGIEKRRKLISEKEISLWRNPAHLFSCFYQLRRAFLYISQGIQGESATISKLRERIWESIFTHDMLSYQQWMYQVVGEFPTIIIGPSGSGKEVIAGAIARSRFIPYLEKEGVFLTHPSESFFPVHLSSLSETLLESELFGHIEGSFTGAIRDHKGVFRIAGDQGSVFLDEIGDVPESVQVKLLRVLQSGEYQPIGGERKNYYKGKIIAATHRDLSERMESGKMREDFFYRLCGDQIQTVSLREILDDSPGEMDLFISFICEKLFGKKGGMEISPGISRILNKSLPEDYLWPGNFRELEQAVRNVVVTGSYYPPKSSGKDQGIDRHYQRTDLSMNQWISLYANQAYENFGSYREAGKQLGVDQRTLKKWALGKSES